MNIIKTINLNVNKKIKTIQEKTIILNDNCNKLLIANYLSVSESAESFLGVLAANLHAGHKYDVNDNTIRNKFGILAALDLLRFPQPRKVINSNSVNAYLNIINVVEASTTLNQTEINLLHNLAHMKDTKGRDGLEVRARYLQLAKTNPQKLLLLINKLRSQYSQITGKLKTAQPTTQQPVVKGTQTTTVGNTPSKQQTPVQTANNRSI